MAPGRTIQLRANLVSERLRDLNASLGLEDQPRLVFDA